MVRSHFGSRTRQNFPRPRMHKWRLAAASSPVLPRWLSSFRWLARPCNQTPNSVPPSPALVDTTLRLDHRHLDPRFHVQVISRGLPHARNRIEPSPTVRPPIQISHVPVSPTDLNLGHHTTRQHSLVTRINRQAEFETLSIDRPDRRIRQARICVLAQVQPTECTGNHSNRSDRNGSKRTVWPAVETLLRRGN